MKIKSLPQDERPVEKSISQGTGSLSNAELLAILLGTGTRTKSAIGLAEDIISADSRGISWLAESSAEELMEINGVGRFKAARIMAAMELGRRISAIPAEKRIRITTTSQVACMFAEELRREKREVFKVLLLNPRGDIITVETVSVGELTSTLVHPREVFNPAVRRSAASMILVHNHPSGDPSPSQEDIDLTTRLQACGKLLGINVIDHIIIGDSQYVSLQSSGYM